jgi:LPXTG-motif cell wall-anchored protein
MKSHPLINSRLIVVLGAAALTAGFFSSRAQADQWDKKTILTVNEPVQVQDTLLQPGQYVFKLQDTNADRHVVQIFNGDQTQIINTILAIPNYRLQPTGNSRFAFWETPPGSAKALRAWFYPGDNFGQEFRYPKQLAMLTMPVPAPAPPPDASTAVPPQAETPAQPEAAPAVPQPQSMTHEVQQEQPAEIAQNSPPQSPAPPSNEGTTELPKTGSFYPLIGLCGLASLGLFSLLRLKRSA